MFPNFTGRAGGKRKVDLSGQRNSNPWAASASASIGASSTVARAQAEREKRHQDKERLKAAKRIQRTYRGYRTRSQLRDSRRKALDQLYENDGVGSRGAKALPLMLSVYQASRPDDHQRLERLCQDLLQYKFQSFTSGETNPTRMGKLARIVLQTLRGLFLELTETQVRTFLETLHRIIHLRPQSIEPVLGEYYQVLAEQCRRWGPSSSLLNLLRDLVVVPLRPANSFCSASYHEFAHSFLTQRNITLFESNIDTFAAHIETDRLSNSFVDEHPGSSISTGGKAGLLWLLAHLIALQRAGQHQGTQLSPPKALSFLLALLSTEIRAAYSTAEPRGSVEFENVTHTLPPYVSDQLASLTDRDAIYGLLERMASKNDGSELDEASSLAGYVLTLVYCFPNLGDEIRMRLFLADLPSKTGRLPAVKYFWNAMSRMPLFLEITSSVDETLDIMCKAPRPTAKAGIESDSPWHQQWRTILLFLELYIFVLKLTDDNEFFGSLSSGAVIRDSTSRLSASGLGLEDLKRLTLFLNHLGFVLHYNAAEIMDSMNQANGAESRDIFGSVLARDKKASRLSEPADPSTFVITAGIDLRSFRDLVTTAVKMLYERDSRRQFLPQDHWLMMTQLQTFGFVSAVVIEEQRQRELSEQLSDDEDPQNDGSDREMDMDVDPPQNFTAAGQRRSFYAQLETLRSRRKQRTRKDHQVKAGPKLEILRNMPFVIPFDLRVRIFRKFVYLDTNERRTNARTPDRWRGFEFDDFSDADPGNLPRRSSRHQAKIRRGQVFADALKAFWELEDGLKDPIRITFLDEFGLTEAGIDGGGVTKEFLTSVTKEAFLTQFLFVANNSNAYYPNPHSLDQQKELLRAAGIPENSEEWQEAITDLLKQYEFLGRIIGKCLYEGILIDVVFAGFFLLKWATGLGSLDGSRANLNDLRELDESLYQGMINLKNYKGNVEDLSLDFTIEDQISGADEPSIRSVTRNLVANGDQIAVTNENRLLYVSRVARHRLIVQPYAQTRAFLRGLGMIINPSWLSMFNQSELQRLVGGDSSPVDVEDLRKNTHYGGVYQIGDDGEEHPTVKLFWQVMHELEDSERRDVLKYVTSTPRAPLLGFEQLKPQFSIRDGGLDQERLPSASTCVNLLKLPQYRTAALLKEKLLYAVKSGAGFGLS